MFTPNTLPRLLLPYISDRKDSYGKDPSIGLRDPFLPDLGRKRLVIEFSSPNIAMEFGSNHLRSTILGGCIANLYKNMGWDVVKINHLGDSGMHMGLLCVGWEKFGSEEQLRADPIRHILSVYHKIQEFTESSSTKKLLDSGQDTIGIATQRVFAERNAFFERLEGGDKQALALCKRFRDVSIEYYAKLYAGLNVSFDEYSGESQASLETMDEVEEMLKARASLRKTRGRG
jgi:arginyl-tRNA synthetase